MFATCVRRWLLPRLRLSSVSYCLNFKPAIHDHILYLRAIALEVIPEAFGHNSNAMD